MNKRKQELEKEADELYPYIWTYQKSNEEWIELFDLQEKVDKIKKLDIEEEDKQDIIESLIDKEFSEYEQDNCYKPRNQYIRNALESDREKPILDLIEEINGELEEINE